MKGCDTKKPYLIIQLNSSDSRTVCEQWLHITAAYTSNRFNRIEWQFVNSTVHSPFTEFNITEFYEGSDNWEYVWSALNVTTSKVYHSDVQLWLC